MEESVFKKSLIKMFGFAATLVSTLPLQAQMHTDSCDDSSCFLPYSIGQNRFWAEADYLYWQVQGSPKVIPLVIEQPVAGAPFDVVLGGEKTKNDWHSGGKFALGYWFDECNNLGVEVNYFFLGAHSKHSSVASNANGSPRLRVPFFNVMTDQPDSSALATPGLFKGAASLKTSNKMQGAEFNIIKEIPFRSCSSFKILAGFRYWNFEDSLTFSVDSPLVVVPTVYNYQDKFRTQNNFYGGQIGACFKQDFSSFFFDVKGKIALGAVHQKSTIEGFFQTNEFTGSVQTFSGGFFALPTNIGHHKKTRFSTILDLNLNFGYHVTDNISICLGYSVIYASQVLRASKQMSSNINPTQSANIEFTPTPVLVGEASPKGKLKSSSLWAQGLNAGLDFIF